MANDKIKKITPVIFVVEASDSMGAERIQRVNEVLAEVVDEFAKINQSKDIIIKFSVLRFASEAQWLTDGFIAPTVANAPRIAAQGNADLGRAIVEINKKLSKHGFIDSSKKYEFPIICFISGEKSTDDYIKPLHKLRKNKWYIGAKKLAVVFGDDDRDIMGEVCGNLKTVVQVKSAALWEQTLRELFSLVIKTISITVSKSINNASDPHEEKCLAERQRLETEAEILRLKMMAAGLREEDCLTAIQRVEMENEKLRLKMMEAKILRLRMEDEERRVKREQEMWRHEESKRRCMRCEIRRDEAERRRKEEYLAEERRLKLDKEEIPERINVSQVQFSAVVPKQLTKGEYGMIDIAVYEDTYRNVVDKIIANADTETREVITSPQEVAENTMVRIVLSSPDVDNLDCDETQKWQGKYLTYSFPVEIPSGYAKKQILFIASVYFNGVIATKLKFIVNCATTGGQKLQLTREDVLSAFISYASEDRSRVATIIQGMKKARPDMDIFFDVESLHSGEYWESALRREIENRDILFLCWSQFAKDSKWVEKEWRYALTNKGLDSIEPIPLVSPHDCPPPAELKCKHFNDKALLYK